MAASKIYDAAIVGGGPSGATAAQRLATGGARVVVFDHSHPREKPCGGGISARARKLFPELEDLVPLGKTGTILRLVSPAGRVVAVQGGGKTFAISRTILDARLLTRAVAAGAEHRAEKVVGVSREKDIWVVSTERGQARARAIIGADGAMSLVRREIIGAIPERHLALGAHVIVPRLDPPSALIRFFGDRRGFAWVFNRQDDSSIGVGMPLTRRADWRNTLAWFFAEQAPGRAMPLVDSWCLPQASSADAFAQPVAGDDWCLIGDAAGHADPLAGEGIIYALWGGELAAQAVLAGKPRSFDRLWRDAFLARLLKHLRLSFVLEKRRAVEALLGLGRLPLVGRIIYGALTSES
jgi:geranylgeranyl reductase